MQPLSPARLLAAWELGVDRHPLDRALLLLSLARPEVPPQALADVPLGVRNAELMALRWSLFGAALEVFIDCAGCGERMSLVLDPSQFPAPANDPFVVEVDGWRFRRPTSRDLATVLDSPDAAAAARRLLHQCAEPGDALPADEVACEALLSMVETRLDQRDPWADIALAVNCPACDRAQLASLDVGAIVWMEFDRLAQALLDEVDLLARAYGWAERDILALSVARRHAYLERVQT